MGMHPGEAARHEFESSAALRASLRPLPTARRRRVPTAPGVLWGRDADVAATRELLLSRQTRELTLVGPPGVGKTRLALAVASSAQAEFEQGAVFVDFAPLARAELVLETIANALGLRQQGALSAAEQLEAHLRDASMLLVLDNLEHLVDAAPDLARLLSQSPELAILATSRTALQLRWERVYEVSTLSLAAAIELFVDRVQAVRGSLSCTADDRTVIGEICTRLDCLPLAIELAAARCVVLSPRELLARLAARLELLTYGPRDFATRHQTLRSAIDWSYELLTEAERRAFRHFAVFVGSFAADAARAASCSSAQVTSELLASLVRKSLIRFEPGTDGTESRFRLLETVREFGLHALAAEGELEAAERAHAEFFLNLVESNYPLNFSAAQRTYMARLERDYPNLRSALAWALDRDASDLALRLAGGLHWFWYSRGYLAEGAAYLERALAHAERACIGSRAVGLRAAGAMALNQGRFARAIELLEEAVCLGRLGEPDGSSRAELAMALGILGVTQVAAGDYTAAEKSIRESLGIFEILDDEWGIATAKEVLGAIAALNGNAEDAEALASSALEVHRRLGSRENVARALDVLGYAALLRGKLSMATSYFDESLQLRREAPNRPATAAVLARLGLVAYLENRWDRAASLYRESLALAQEVGDAAGVVRCLGQIAALGLACGADRGAVAQLGMAVQHHRAALGLPSPPVERIAAQRLASALRHELSTVGLAVAWVGGRVTGVVQDLEKATSLGFSLLDGISRPTSTEPARDGAEHLTRREMQVAALIAQGLTNRQIAEELVIATRTVDTHVERILSKLNFATRAQVAAWITARAPRS